MARRTGNLSMVLRLAAAGDFADIAALAALAFRRKIVAAGRKPPARITERPSPGPLSFQPTEDPLVSIVIAAHNHWDVTSSCLAALAEQAGKVPFEVILADDASTDETRECEKTLHGVSILTNEANLGFLRTCNQAVRQAKGSYVVLLNNDTIVQEGWLEALLEPMSRDRSIGMIGPKLLYPDGRLQEAGGIVWNDGAAWNYGKGDDPDLPRYNYSREADYLSGACIMIRKSLWDEIGGFDERYVPAYCEDTDLAFEVRKRGYRVVYEPESVVVHLEGTSCGTDTRSGIKRYQELNREKFTEKWRQVLKNRHFLAGQLRLAVKAKTVTVGHESVFRSGDDR